MPNFQRSNNGFSIWFEHAGVSVQFGPGSYGDHYDADLDAPPAKHLMSEKAEVAIRTTEPKGPFITEKWNARAAGGVLGWATPQEVASAIAWAAAYVPEPAGLAPALGGK